MPQTEWILIDGNNLLHHALSLPGAGRPADFTHARALLARRMEQLAGELGIRVTLVYDGRRGGRDEAFQEPRFEVIYTEHRVTADSMIERRVAAAPQADSIVVVTSDRHEREYVVAAGAAAMSCTRFLELVNDTRSNIEQALDAQQRLSFKATIGDLFPYRS